MIPTPARLGVLTLNIWNRQGPWEKRLPLIRRGIEALAPDLVGLQEVLRHDHLQQSQAEEIAAGLGYHIAYGPAWHIGGGLHLGNAVLSRFPVERSQCFTLPGGADGDDESRQLLAVEVAAPFGRVPFFVTHLNWKFHHGAIRVRQVAAIAEHLGQFAPAGSLPAILVGDFNAEPESDEIRFLSGLHPIDGKSIYLADCFRLTGQGPGPTFCRRNPHAAPLREPDRRIDYIFVRGPDRDGRGEPLSSRVVLDAGAGGDDAVFPSDHFGVYAELGMGS